MMAPRLRFVAKKGRHPRGGRVTPKGTRPQGFRPRHDAEVVTEPEPDLMRDVRLALADDHPLGLLALVSSLLAALDPRRVSPLERSRSKPAGPSLEELMATFMEVDRLETSALLTAFAALSGNDIDRRRIARTVDARGHRLPTWLTRIGEADAGDRAVEMAHVLRDGDNVMLGVRFATAHELTAVVYIDHNLGTLVKDAFIVPEPLEQLVEFMREKADDPDTEFSDIPVADAKARIVDAIETGAITFPPFETETWPACRPLVEWMLSLLPDGGRGYERPEWSAQDREDLTERFFASSFAASLDDIDHRGLLDSLLWFGCDYGPGDPMRWSPVAVEILLDDWIPRKIVADVPYLSKAPGVLRAFVRFCHAERNILGRLTDETLNAIDRWEPEYQTMIRSPRPQGPAALLAAIGALDPDGPWETTNDDDEPWDYPTVMRGFLERAVGGSDALDALDDRPLPDEPFSWDGIADDIRERVGEVLDLCDRCCDELFDTELRTACRRVLARIGVNGPEVFRRRGRSDTAAAAVCWSVCRVNDVFDQRQGGFTQKALLAHFGLQNGSVSQRAGTLLDAGGFPRFPNDFALGSPDYLVSGRRRDILEKRARVAEYEQREAVLRRMGTEAEDLGLEY